MSFAQRKARMERILRACNASSEIVADFDGICQYRTTETAEELLYDICIRHGYTKPYERKDERINVRPCSLGQRHPDHHDDSSGDSLVAEQSYRRGYDQGANEVLQMLKAGGTTAQIEQRIHQIHQWRLQPLQVVSSPGFTTLQKLPDRWDTV